MFFNRSAGNYDNDFWKVLDIPHYPPASTYEPPKHIPLQKLLLDVSNVFYYVGSIPYPPCTEGVSWFLYNSPQPISDEQINNLQSWFNGTYRETQNGTPSPIFKEGVLPN